MNTRKSIISITFANNASTNSHNRGASLNYRERNNEKVSWLRMLVDGLSWLTRRSSGSEVNREIFPRNRNSAQPDTDFYYSHRPFSRSRRGKCVPQIMSNISVCKEKA